jgi:integrase
MIDGKRLRPGAAEARSALKERYIYEDLARCRFRVRVPSPDRRENPDDERKPEDFKYKRGDAESRAAALAAARHERGLREEVFAKAAKRAAVLNSPLHMLSVSKGFERYLESEKVDQLRSKKDRKRILDKDVGKHIGSMLIISVTHRDVQEVLDKAARRGLSRGSVKHIRNAICHTWMWFKRQGYSEVNGKTLLSDVETPDAKIDDRERETLTDAEVLLFLQSPKVRMNLKVMAIMSRECGGPRTSDLLALEWRHIDTEKWEWCYIPRPKTARSKGQKWIRIGMPPATVHWLKLWWMKSGRPSGTAPVFPTYRKGRKSDVAKGEKVTYRGVSFARTLRRALKRAGVTRPSLFDKDNFAKKQVDFHSFRRSFATAVARAGVNLQTAKQLTGHESDEVHQRYVMTPDVLEIPDAAAIKWT